MRWCSEIVCRLSCCSLTRKAQTLALLGCYCCALCAWAAGMTCQLHVAVHLGEGSHTFRHISCLRCAGLVCFQLQSASGPSSPVLCSASPPIGCVPQRSAPWQCCLSLMPTLTPPVRHPLQRAVGAASSRLRPASMQQLLRGEVATSFSALRCRCCPSAHARFMAHLQLAIIALQLHLSCNP